MDNYRIYRIDPNNIAIQKKRGKEWRTVRRNKKKSLRRL
jgi:hypothetical protein